MVSTMSHFSGSIVFMFVCPLVIFYLRFFDSTFKDEYLATCNFYSVKNNEAGLVEGQRCVVSLLTVMHFPIRNSISYFLHNFFWNYFGNMW